MLSRSMRVSPAVLASGSTIGALLGVVSGGVQPEGLLAALEEDGEGVGAAATERLTQRAVERLGLRGGPDDDDAVRSEGPPHLAEERGLVDPGVVLVHEEVGTV